MSGLDRNPAEQQVHPDGDRDEHDHRQSASTRFRGSRRSPGGAVDVGLDREMHV